MAKHLSGRFLYKMMSLLLAAVAITCVPFEEGLSFLMGSRRSDLSLETPGALGRLTSAGNGWRRTYFDQYDALGRAKRIRHALEGKLFSYSYQYGYPTGAPSGPGSVLKSMQYPNCPTDCTQAGETVSYGYDLGGAQQSITVGAAPVIKSIKRNAQGATTKRVYAAVAPNTVDTVSTLSYNDDWDLRLNRIETVAATGTIQDLRYQFDQQGNVTSVEDVVDGQNSATYEYDSLDQLKKMTPSGASALHFDYDGAGNLSCFEGASANCTNQSYVPGTHRLQTDKAGKAYLYDSNGNARKIGDRTITWNAENMATFVSDLAVAVNAKEFVNEAVWRKEEGTTLTYYLPGLRVETDTEDDTTVYRKFYGDGLVERRPEDADKLRYYHPDHLGSTVLVTNPESTAAANTVAHAATYMPYGGVRRETNPGYQPKYRFNFKEKEASEYYDYGARMYNPASGRWLSPDSVLADGPNRYAYVSNNPLTFVDPTGHEEKEKNSSFLQEVGEYMYASETDPGAIPGRLASGELSFTAALAIAAIEIGGGAAVTMALPRIQGRGPSRGTPVAISKVVVEPLAEGTAVNFASRLVGGDSALSAAADYWEAPSASSFGPVVGSLIKAIRDRGYSVSFMEYGLEDVPQAGQRLRMSTSNPGRLDREGGAVRFWKDLPNAKLVRELTHEYGNIRIVDELGFVPQVSGRHHDYVTSQGTVRHLYLTHTVDKVVRGEIPRR